MSLWELVARSLWKNKGRLSGKIKDLAVELNSYAGLSLAAYLANDKDALLRAQYLELAYEGQR